jgi:hypothetical protein
MYHLHDLHKILRYGCKIFQLVQEVEHAMLPHKKKLDFVVTYSSAKLSRPFVDLHHFYFPFSPDPKIQSLLAK